VRLVFDVLGNSRVSAPSVLVLGIGNLLLGDEGVGVHAVRMFEKKGLPPHVALVDGGTGGFHLLGCLREHPTVILIDATLDGSPPGTVRVREPRYPSDYPRSLTAHDIGLRDLIESAALLGPMPRVILVTISVAEIQPMKLELSEGVQAALGQVETIVRELVAGPEPGDGRRAVSE
jgi:hydrogenase maturation protease